jgi:hypothetical protein
LVEFFGCCREFVSSSGSGGSGSITFSGSLIISVVIERFGAAFARVGVVVFAGN